MRWQFGNPNQRKGSQMKHLLLASTVLTMAAAPALAGSVVAPTPDPTPVAPIQVQAPVYDWTGPYAGVYGGGLWGEQTATPPGATDTFDFATSYGGFAGYNVQSGSIVYGGEIAAGFYNGAPTGSPTDEFDYIGDAKLRLGYAMDNVLLYGFGGASTAHYSDPGAPDDWQLWGANFGAGVEFGVSENVVIGGEYIGRYLTGEDSGGTSYDNWLHGAQARISIRF